jgi:TPP-dependent pyruvate/acetoin dehydrogenase alpha subunit
MVKQSLISKSNSSRPSGVSGATALALHRSMVRIRRTQEAIMAEYHPADEMRCPIHFCLGQEGPPAGVGLALRPDDYMFTGHRSHGYYLAKGSSLQGLIAELYGKVTGSNRGKAGHHEVSDEDANFYSGTILVGTLPIAAGAALAAQMRGEDRVAIAVFGDGGADQGIVYEALNFAAVKKLPMVFICENNLYSIYSNQASRQSPCDLAGRSRAFGVPARRMNGNDVLSVYRAASRAISKARRGDGPSLLELDTYRWCGHVGPEDDDHFGYRTQEELDSWKERCPIEELQGSLIGSGILDYQGVERVEAEIALEIREAFEFAKSSPFPGPEELLKGVFADQGLESLVPVDEGLVLPFDYQQPEAVPGPY